MYSRDEKISRLMADIIKDEYFVMAGSMSSFHQAFDPFFDLMVFLDLDQEIRLQRLHQRELEQFGERILAGGDMYEEHRNFLTNSARYDSDGSPNRQSHLAWAEEVGCPLLKLNGADSVATNMERIVRDWYLNREPVLYAGLRLILQRGTAEILEQSGQGLFLKDCVSGMYMLAADMETGLNWLRKHEEKGYGLLVVFQQELADMAQKRYGYSRRLDCFQAAYQSKIVPQRTKRLRIEIATEKDLQTVMKYYDLLSEEELKEGLRQGNLFLAYYGDELVGFVGQHLEGCMGILEVLPQYRRKGFGKELEQFMIAHILEQGLIPYCQVEKDNNKSLNLQKSLGLSLSEKKVYVLY